MTDMNVSERFFTGIKDDPELHVKLTGNWETVVGPLDTFHHIVEYENYDGYDKTMALIKKSKVCMPCCMARQGL